MNAQAVRNAARRESPPLLALGDDAELSQGDGEESEEEVYEVNSNGKRVHARAQRNTKLSTNRPPKAADYDAHTKAKILLASAILTAIAVSEDPFPSNEATVEMAGFAWDTALDKLDAFPVDEQAEWYSIVSPPLSTCTLADPVCRSFVLSLSSADRSGTESARRSPRHMDSTNDPVESSTTVSYTSAWSKGTRLFVRYVSCHSLLPRPPC